MNISKNKKCISYTEVRLYMYFYSNRGQTAEEATIDVIENQLPAIQKLIESGNYLN